MKKLALSLALLFVFVPSVSFAAGLTNTQVQAILSLLSSFSADASVIANVQAALTGSPASVSSPSTSSPSCDYSQDLMLGSSGSEVSCLQSTLIASGDSIPAGATGYFGKETQTALMAWQKAHGVTANGYFGSTSRSVFNTGSSHTTAPVTTISTSTAQNNTNQVNTPDNIASSAGAGLQVTLAPTSSSNESTFLEGEKSADLSDFIFTNPTNKSIEVTDLSFKILGTLNLSSLSNFQLDANGTYFIPNDESGNQFSFGTADGIFLVPADQSLTVSVLGDVASGTSGQQIAIQLISTVSDGSTYTVTPSVTSNYQTVTAVNSQEQISCATLANLAYQTQKMDWASGFVLLERVHYNQALNQCLYEFTVMQSGWTGGPQAVTYDGVLNAASNSTLLWGTLRGNGDTYTNSSNQNISGGEYYREQNYYMTH